MTGRWECAEPVRARVAAWPAVVWNTPVLRGVDEHARAAVEEAGRLVSVSVGEMLYRDGDASDSFFIVVRGAVELRAVRRGDDSASVVRVARAGDAFGEEALLPGLPRRAAAIVADAATVAEVPVAVFQRITGRAVGAATEREQRYIERATARDLLACAAFARELSGVDVELLLDAARLERVPRGARIYEPGALADRVYFVVEGLVQLQREDDEARPVIAAYVARGDFFGDQEALAGIPRRHAAVAAGETWCAAVPRQALRTLADRNPGLLPRLRRVAEAQEAIHGELIGAAEARSTRHVFQDLYRMQIARSLLVIDQDSCVRCGHCAWSCASVHGTSRLIRRGDKVVAQLANTDAATLLLPNTCQHCRHAACMIDCPTGAIGRDPEGEVFIRPELCTGCGNCAKACPWDNIQMAPRPAPLVQLRRRPPAAALGSAGAGSTAKPSFAVAPDEAVPVARTSSPSATTLGSTAAASTAKPSFAVAPDEAVPVARTNPADASMVGCSTAMPAVAVARPNVAGAASLAAERANAFGATAADSTAVPAVAVARPNVAGAASLAAARSNALGATAADSTAVPAVAVARPNVAGAASLAAARSNALGAAAAGSTAVPAVAVARPNAAGVSTPGSSATGSTAVVRPNAAVAAMLGLSPEVAVKCDLCRGFEAPACVEACPTGAVLRIDPSRDFAEVARVFGSKATEPAPRSVGIGLGPALVWSIVAALMIAGTVVVGVMRQVRGWSPERGIGFGGGIVAAAMIAALAAYVVPKRRVRARMRRRSARSDADTIARSRTRVHLIAHLVVGALLPAAAIAHAGAHFRASPGGAAAAALVVAVGLGAVAALAYRIVPRALTRLERRGSLPEDLDGQREQLEARLFRAVSGTSDRVKALVDRVLLPYASSRTGAIALALCGRTLADERRRLRTRIDALLEGRTIHGTDELVDVAVELRAWPARRFLERTLRVWPPLHAIAGATVLALVTLHIAVVVAR